MIKKSNVLIPWVSFSGAVKNAVGIGGVGRPHPLVEPFGAVLNHDAPRQRVARSVTFFLKVDPPEFCGVGSGPGRRDSRFMTRSSGPRFAMRHVLFQCLGVDLVDDSILIEVSRRVVTRVAGRGQIGRSERGQVGLIDRSVAVGVTSQRDVQRVRAGGAVSAADDDRQWAGLADLHECGGLPSARPATKGRPCLSESDRPSPDSTPTMRGASVLPDPGATKMPKSVDDFPRGQVLGSDRHARCAHAAGLQHVP